MATQADYFNKGIILLSSDNFAITVAMFSILSLKSEMVFVTKSKGACGGMFKSEETSGSEQPKRDWQLWGEKT